MLKSVVDDNLEGWDTLLPYLMMAYKASVHEAAKCSPNLLLFGNENRLPVDIMYAESSVEGNIPQCPCEYIEWVRDASREAFSKAREHLKHSAEREKRTYDKNTYMRRFRVGDWVWVLHPPELRNKFGKGWKGPFLVVKILGEVNYVVQEKPTARKITLHVDHMKKYEHSDVPESWVITGSKMVHMAVQTD
jgi:ribosomal protein L21E